MSNDRLDRALKLWEQFPDNELVRYNLAQSLFDAEDYDGAAEHLHALCAKRADWMVVHILLGKSLLALGRRDEARPFLQQAHELAVAQHHDGPREELAALLKSW